MQSPQSAHGAWPDGQLSPARGPAPSPTPTAHESTYSAAFELAPCGLVVTDDQGVIAEANLSAETLLGLPGGALRGKALAVFVPDRDRKALREHTAEAAAGQRPQWRGTVTPAQGHGPPVPVQFAVSRCPNHALLWSLTNLSRVAALESEVRRLDDGMWARVAERTVHLTLKIEQLEAELRSLKEPRTGPENMRA